MIPSAISLLVLSAQAPLELVDGSQHGGDPLPVPEPEASHRAKIGLVSISGASTFRSVTCR